MLMSLFMTTSDLSDQTKPWESACIVSDLLYAEFFAQGDTVSSFGLDENLVYAAYDFYMFIDRLFLIMSIKYLES